MTLPMADPLEQNRALTDIASRERPRLRNFIRSRVANESDVEDILQDVFYELIEAMRLMRPIEQVGAWLFRVARNRIIDLFRRKKPEALSQPVGDSADSTGVSLEDLLLSPEAGPEA